MPIEINEIAIQMKVGDEADSAAKADSPGASHGGALSAAERDAIVKDCVKRVLLALDMNRER